MLPERSEQLEIERSLFESAEYPTMQPEANSKPSPHLPAVGSHSAQPGSLLEMPPSRAQSHWNYSEPPAVARIRARGPRKLMAG